MVERAALAFSLVESWLFSEPMTELFAEFGGKLPEKWYPVPGDDGVEAVKGLSPAQADVMRRAVVVENMAAADFDFRSVDGKQYGERSQAGVADFDAERRERVARLADQLGLVTPRPARFSRYDKTLVLGAGYRSPQLRSRYAAQVQAAGVDLGELSFLGSPRFLIDDPAELPVVEGFAPGAHDEFDLMMGAARTEFGLTTGEVTFLCGCVAADLTCPAWRHRGADGVEKTPPAYTHERQVELFDRAGHMVGSVLSASTSRPPRRPDTSDTFALWARCADPRPGQRVLVVTTQMFVPFQNFDGIRRLNLPHGVEVDTVGLGAEWGDRLETAENLLQETLSAVRSGRRLLDAAAETLMCPPRAE
ncbi:hypothetical protein [Longispora fulva]|uniref:Uncharacterized protein n=1 Tax=Longispora fulva TaxID=619741 RepID=A0A8J7KPQ5_9ACTN|nr:hypothetical protein [Longispora fulva]MBG6141576.1 hypothetical protein [Longispora fulva]